MRLTANLEDRTITGLALPYGEPGRTNLGKVIASAGSVAIPDDHGAVTLNLEHSATAPVGRATAITETPEGLVATFRVARTRAGDDLLAEVEEGLRTGLSVELDSPVIRAGRLVSGALSAVAAVVKPAFPSALLTAADAGELDDEDETQVSTDETPDPAPAEDGSEAEEADDEEEKPTVGEKIMATAPAGTGTLLASKMTGEDGPTSGDLFKRLAAAGATMSPAKMLAALDEVTAADVFSVVTQPQYLGELWSGKQYVERYAPLVGSATLTGPKVTGWRFVTNKAPTVASYAGFPTQPTSNEVDTEAIEESVSRIAGAWALDRIHRDFPSEAFWSAFFKAVVEDYARKRDAAVLAHLIADASETVIGTIPTGVSEAAVRIVDGALEMIDFATPTFAIVGSDLYRDFLLSRREDSLEFLSVALGFENGSLNGFRIVPSSDAGLLGKVLVGSREAVTHHELPGVPIRVDAESISTGGVESGVFGYYALITHDARGLVLVGDESS